MSIEDVNINDSARAFIAKLQRQQRTQSPGPFGLLREGSQRTRHLSEGAWPQSSAAGRLHCEECGQRINGESICSGCHASPTRVWLQFVSLGTLAVLTAYNYVFVLTFLRGHVPRTRLASVWLNVSEFSWHYGWITLGLYLPVWAYYSRKKYGYPLENGIRVAIAFVVILLMGTIARPMLSQVGGTWAEPLRTTLESRPELGIVVGWAVVALAFVSICCNCESRDRLLGRGKGLALLTLTALCIILGLTLLTS